MSGIFISYARSDVDFARKLARSLSEMGADIWIDVENIPAGMKWSTAIQQGLNVCDVMLVIISPEAMASNNVEDEWQYYLDKKKHVIPIWYRPADKHFQISRLQHVDFHTASYHIAFDRLLHELNVKGVAIQLPTTDYTEAEFTPDSSPTQQTEPSSPKPAPIVPSPAPARRSDSSPPKPAPIASSPAPARRGEASLPKPVPSEPAPGTRIIDDKGIEMVYIPAGKFLIGADYISHFEKPIHEVQIAKPFWLDLTPVTNAAYARFVTEGGYRNKFYWTKSGWEWLQKEKITAPQDYDGFIDPSQPRVGVSWYEASAYARWRGGRLPAEAEWEWAARGPENRIYPWGNTFDATRLIFKDNSGSKTAVVGSTIRLSGASWVGALDMSGNVWEWCGNLLQPYQADVGREDQYIGGTRVLRGGSWFDDADSALSARRGDFDPGFRRNFFGFRLLRPTSQNR